METLGSHVGFKPLYSQVRDEIVRRLADGLWEPGPSCRANRSSPGLSASAREPHARPSIPDLGRCPCPAPGPRHLRRGIPGKPDPLPVLPSGSRRRRAPVPLFAGAQALVGGCQPGGTRRAPSRTGRPRLAIERVRNFKDEPILTETLSLSVARFPELEAFAKFPTTSTGSTQPSTAFRSPSAPSASRRSGQPPRSPGTRLRRGNAAPPHLAQRFTTPTNRPSSASPIACDQRPLCA